MVFHSNMSCLEYVEKPQSTEDIAAGALCNLMVRYASLFVIMLAEKKCCHLGQALDRKVKRRKVTLS